MNNHTVNRRNKQLEIILVLVIAIIILGMMLYIARYGQPTNDEEFHLSMPYRFLLGDAMFRDEWHPSQMFSFLMVPLVHGLIGLGGGY